MQTPLQEKPSYEEMESLDLTLPELEKALLFLAEDRLVPPPGLRHLSRGQWGMLHQFLTSLNEEKSSAVLH